MTRRSTHALAVLAAFALGAAATLSPAQSSGGKRDTARPSADEARAKRIAAALANLDATDPEVRLKAIYDLGTCRATEAKDRLKRILEKDESTTARWHALRALIDMDDSTVVPDARRMLAGRDVQGKLAATSALLLFEDTESYPAIVKFVETTGPGSAWVNLLRGGRPANRQVREAAIICVWLGRLEAAVPLLEKSLTGKDRRDHFRVLSALAMIGQKKSAPRIARFIQELDRGDRKLDRNDGEVLVAAVRALGATDPLPFLDLLEKHAKSDRPELRKQATAALIGTRLPEYRRQAYEEAGVALNGYEHSELVRKLEGVTMRSSRLKMLSLAKVLDELSKKVELPIELSATVDQAVLEGHFGGYVDYLGFHARGMDILSAIGGATFSGPAGPGWEGLVPWWRRTACAW